MKKQMIVFDLDGTLVYGNHEIDQETVNYIKKIKEQGHIIVLATGRPFRSSVEFYRMLELDTPIINYNGALVTNPCDEDFVETNITVPKEVIIDIFESQREYIYNAFGEVRDTIYVYQNNDDIRPLLHYFEGGELIEGEFKDTLHSDPNGFIIISHRGGVGQNIQDYIEAKYKDYNSRNWGSTNRHIIEVYTKETSKGFAVERLLKQFNMSNEDLMVFGDAGNDIEMLDLANVSVVMSNAEDFVKEHASHITTYPCQEQGVLHFLKEYFKI